MHQCRIAVQSGVTSLRENLLIRLTCVTTYMCWSSGMYRSDLQMCDRIWKESWKIGVGSPSPDDFSVVWLFSSDIATALRSICFGKASRVSLTRDMSELHAWETTHCRRFFLSDISKGKILWTSSTTRATFLYVLAYWVWIPGIVVETIKWFEDNRF